MGTRAGKQDEEVAASSLKLCGSGSLQGKGGEVEGERLKMWHKGCTEGRGRD